MVSIADYNTIPILTFPLKGKGPKRVARPLFHATVCFTIVNPTASATLIPSTAARTFWTS